MPKLAKILHQDRKRLYVSSEQWHKIKQLARQCSVSERRDVSIIEMLDRLIRAYRDK